MQKHLTDEQALRNYLGYRSCTTSTDAIFSACENVYKLLSHWEVNKSAFNLARCVRKLQERCEFHNNIWWFYDRCYNILSGYHD